MKVVPIKILLAVGIGLMTITASFAKAAECIQLPQSKAGKMTEPGAVKHPAADVIRKKGRKLYSALIAIKKEKDFINNGYGNSPNKTRYQKWDKEVLDLHSECSAELNKLGVAEKIQSELFDVCVATTNLNTLGMHYAMNGCVEDRSTMTWNVSIKKAFKLSKP